MSKVKFQMENGVRIQRKTGIEHFSLVGMGLAGPTPWDGVLYLTETSTVPPTGWARARSFIFEF